MSTRYEVTLVELSTNETRTVDIPLNELTSRPGLERPAAVNKAFKEITGKEQFEVLNEWKVLSCYARGGTSLLADEDEVYEPLSLDGGPATTDTRCDQHGRFNCGTCCKGTVMNEEWIAGDGIVYVNDGCCTRIASGIDGEDANLIAAAPDLLKALKTVLFAVTDDVTNNGGKVDRNAIEEVVTAAIAKAKP